MNFHFPPELTVLIVDDEREIRLILKSILVDIGIKSTIEAEDAKHALRMIKYSHKPIHLILCDWNLPGISGLDFLDQLHAQNLERPFFIISGRSDLDSVLSAKTHGVKGYIRKPFSAEQVESHIFSSLKQIAESESL